MVTEYIGQRSIADGTVDFGLSLLAISNTLIFAHCALLIAFGAGAALSPWSRSFPLAASHVETPLRYLLNCIQENRPALMRHHADRILTSVTESFWIRLAADEPH